MTDNIAMWIGYYVLIAGTVVVVAQLILRRLGVK